MPPMCLVPHCPTGSRHSRAVNQRHPMFNIPRDENLKRKWEEVIPGDIKLKYGQVVCAKHFLKNQLITEFELKDKFGNVIGKQAYKRPRLKKNAVPSIFEMPISIRKDDDDTNFEGHNFSVICSKSPNRLKEAERQEDNFSKVKGVSAIETLQNNVFDPDLLKIISRKYSKGSDVRNVTYSNFHVESNNHSTNGNSTFTDFQNINSLTNKSNFSHLSFAGYSIHSNTNYENNKVTPKQNNEQNNSLQVYYKSIICINNEEIEVPNSWSIIQKRIKNQLTLIFTHSVSIIVNESENKDKIKKYVMYNCSNGNARYFAHGKEVAGIYEEHLLPRLISAELLVTTLLKFEKMRMCEGFKKEYMLSTIVGEHYMDKFNTWRTKQCTLLTRKFKKCEYCNKLVRKLLKRRTRWMHRVQTGSKLHVNPDFKDKVDSSELFKKKSGTSIEDEFIKEIDSFEFSNDQETVIKKINIVSDTKKQICSNDRIEKSIIHCSDTSIPTTFKFLFEIEK